MSAKKSNRSNNSNKPQEPTPQARRKQVILGLVMGLIVGGVLAFFTQFPLWIAAGAAMGLATGMIMKPPAE